jgi:hypothetical protein
MTRRPEGGAGAYSPPSGRRLPSCDGRGSHAALTIQAEDRVSGTADTYHALRRPSPSLVVCRLRAARREVERRSKALQGRRFLALGAEPARAGPGAGGGARRPRGLARRPCRSLAIGGARPAGYGQVGVNRPVASCNTPCRRDAIGPHLSPPTGTSNVESGALLAQRAPLRTPNGRPRQTPGALGEIAGLEQSPSRSGDLPLARNDLGSGAPRAASAPCGQWAGRGAIRRTVLSLVPAHAPDTRRMDEPPGLSWRLVRRIPRHQRRASGCRSYTGTWIPKHR